MHEISFLNSSELIYFSLFPFPYIDEGDVGLLFSIELNERVYILKVGVLALYALGEIN